MRARAVAGLLLLVPSGVLAACDDTSPSTKPGDVIKARENDQFVDGKDATVALPTGRLLISTTEPVDSADADETRTRETVNAPAGAVLVPITWQYDTWASDRLDGIMATTTTPIVDLVSGDQDYRLPPPDRDNEAGDSFYVVVDGDGADSRLEIEFEGVVQSVDLETGSTDEGRAAALDDIDDTELRRKACDDETWFDTPATNAEFDCGIVGPVLTPYAGGEWAPDGSLWLALTLTTEMRIYAVTNLLGSGARYAARSVKVSPDIDGEDPVKILSTGDNRDVCPVPGQGTCGWAKHLIFEVPADDGEQGPLDIRVAYKLKLLNQWGTWSAEERPSVEAKETFKLWSD